jgi:hypothetical protein
LASISDALLNGISSAGIEYLFLGLPVVTHAPAQFFTYPLEFNILATRSDEYFDRINQALSSGWSIENIRNSFRWKSFQFTRLSIDLSDAIPDWNNKSPLRIARGLKYQKGIPVPSAVVVGLARSVASRRPENLRADLRIYGDLTGEPTIRAPMLDPQVTPESARAIETAELVRVVRKIAELPSMKFETSSPLSQAVGQFLQLLNEGFSS